MENIVSILVGITLRDLVKWMFVFGLIMYSAFAVVVIRQVKVMSEAIEGSLNDAFRILSWIHLLMAILLVVAAIFVL